MSSRDKDLESLIEAPEHIFTHMHTDNGTPSSSSSLLLSWARLLILISSLFSLWMLYAAMSSDLSSSSSLPYYYQSTLNISHLDVSSLVYHPEFQLDPQAVMAFKHHIQENAILTNHDQVLIVTVANMDYSDFASNWICHMHRHDINNWIIACTDYEVCHYLAQLGYASHTINILDMFDSDALRACEGKNTRYGDPCFIEHTKTKMRLVTISLLAGFNTMVLDLDVTLVQNPLLYLPMQHWLEIQLDNEDPQTVNAGFYYVQSNAFNILMCLQVMHMIVPGHGDEQDNFNRYLARSIKYFPLLMKDEIMILSPRVFPSGRQWNLASGVIQHNNWIEGSTKKRERQKDKGYLIFDQQQTQNKLDNQTADQNFPLVCHECTGCALYKALVEPLRHEVGGPLLTTQFRDYSFKLDTGKYWQHWKDNESS